MLNEKLKKKRTGISNYHCKTIIYKPLIIILYIYLQLKNNNTYIQYLFSI